MQNGNKDNSGGKQPALNKTQVILICGFAVVIVVVIVGFLFLMNRKEPVKERGPIGVITSDNVGEIVNEVQDRIAKGTMQVNMNTVWRFDDAVSASYNAVIRNAEVNNFPFYFDLMLKDTEEIIYTSPLMPLGTQLNELILETELPAGTYAAVCKYHLVDEENNEEISGNTAVNVTVIIEN